MSFRPATLDDEEFFFYWRNRAELEGLAGKWWEGTLTSREQHHVWFTQRLGRIIMLVWYPEDRPAGAVRIDSNGEIAFHANPLLAPRMLKELKPYVDAYGGRFKVTVDKGNREASRALRKAGFREYPVRFFAYKPGGQA